MLLSTFNCKEICGSQHTGVLKRLKGVMMFEYVIFLKINLTVCKGRSQRSIVLSSVVWVLWNSSYLLLSQSLFHKVFFNNVMSMTALQ